MCVLIEVVFFFFFSGTGGREDMKPIYGTTVARKKDRAERGGKVISETLCVT